MVMMITMRNCCSLSRETQVLLMLKSPEPRITKHKSPATDDQETQFNPFKNMDGHSYNVPLGKHGIPDI